MYYVFICFFHIYNYVVKSDKDIFFRQAVHNTGGQSQERRKRNGFGGACVGGEPPLFLLYCITPVKSICIYSRANIVEY